MTLSERGEEDAGAEDPEDVLQAALLSQLPGSGGGGGGSCQPQATAAAQSDGDGSPKEDADSSHGMDSNGSTKESLDPKLSVASSEYDSEASSAGVMRSISPHYNARDDIILRFEFLRTNEMKVGLDVGCLACFFEVLHMPADRTRHPSVHLCCRLSFVRCGSQYLRARLSSSWRFTSK